MTDINGLRLKDWPEPDAITLQLIQALTDAGLPMDERIDIKYWEDESSLDHWDIEYHIGDGEISYLTRFTITADLVLTYEIISDHPMCPWLADKCIDCIATQFPHQGPTPPKVTTYTNWATHNRYPESFTPDLVIARLMHEKELHQFKYPVLGRVYTQEGI